MELKNLLTNRFPYGILNMKSEGHTIKPERKDTMELNVKLTADELKDVVDAAMDEAINRGYDADDETVDDMLHIVDAALSAMGIEIVPADEDEDEEEDYDPIEEMLYVLDDGRTAIGFKDACFLMDVLKAVGRDRGLPEEEANKAAQKIFLQISEDYGIDVVEKEEEEEDEPEEEQEYPDNPVSRCVFLYDGKRAIKASDADAMVKAMTEVVDEHFSFLPEEIKQKIRMDTLHKIFEENGVEIVVKGE